MAKYETTVRGDFDALRDRIIDGILGGSQALFFKVNTWGEETFLEKLMELLQ
jgi:hypothetical protein